MNRYDRASVDRFSDELSGASAPEILVWATEKLSPERLTFASSFGAEDVVLIDLISQMETPTRVFTLDTGRLHQETYDLIDRIRNRYQLPIEVYAPAAEALQTMLVEHGPNLFYDSVELRKRCCGVRKLEPLARALGDVDGWITGLRASQSVTRTETGPVEIDHAHGGILKINPLHAWSAEDVWNHIRVHSVPYNTLHDSGFPSIGCAPCTRATAPGEDIRAGRWWWENPELRECGLHPGGGKAQTTG